MYPLPSKLATTLILQSFIDSIFLKRKSRGDQVDLAVRPPRNSYSSVTPFARQENALDNMLKPCTLLVLFSTLVVD